MPKEIELGYWIEKISAFCFIISKQQLIFSWYQISKAKFTKQECWDSIIVTYSNDEWPLLIAHTLLMWAAVVDIDFFVSVLPSLDAASFVNFQFLVQYLKETQVTTTGRHFLNSTLKKWQSGSQREETEWMEWKIKAYLSKCFEKDAEICPIGWFLFLL